MYLALAVIGDDACCSEANMFAIGGRCADFLEEKYTWDKTDSGYCLENSQCLVNPNINHFEFYLNASRDIDNPYGNEIRCINNTEFIGDHYCNDGKWTVTKVHII